jgi:hypothetical protein
MAHFFVPLVAAPASELAKNTSAMPLGQAAVDFKNMSKVSPAHANHAPKITVQRDGDKITKIHIICSCSQVIELDCVY